MINKCSWCNGTGKFKKPKNIKAFDAEFDRLDIMAIFDSGECREKALKESGYIEVVCSHCNGTGKC